MSELLPHLSTVADDLAIIIGDSEQLVGIGVKRIERSYVLCVERRPGILAGLSKLVICQHVDNVLQIVTDGGSEADTHVEIG